MRRGFAIGSGLFVAVVVLLRRHGDAEAQPCARQCAAELRDANGCCPSAATPPSHTHSVHVTPPTPSVEAPACPADMATIPGGTGPSGNVARFCLDKVEVSVASYGACVNAGACTSDRVHTVATCNFGSGRMSHPMNCVDWGQAVTYCAWHGRRLPTEGEFEWAAQGAAAATKYPWGNDEPQAQLCWSGLSKRSGTCAVSTFTAGNSPQGVADLAGNVWEWTSSPDGSGRVALGGSWYSVSASKVEATNRNSNSLTYRGDALGFRCAKAIP